MKKEVFKLIDESKKLIDHATSMGMATGYKKKFNYANISLAIRNVTEKFNNTNVEEEEFIRAVIKYYFTGKTVEEAIKIAAREFSK